MQIVGSKNGNGVKEWLIGIMPPHRVYVEACFGSGAIMRAKRPAAVNIGIDCDATVTIRQLRRRRQSKTMRTLLPIDRTARSTTAGFACRIPLGMGAAQTLGMTKFKYGETIKLQPPQGAILDGQVVSAGRWDRVEVCIRTWQQYFFLSDLLADGWQIVTSQNETQKTP